MVCWQHTINKLIIHRLCGYNPDKGIKPNNTGKTMKLKPHKLTPGDTIGLIAPSGVIKDYNMLDQSIKNITDRGYKVKTANNIKSKQWYLAGSDEERLKDLHSLFADPEVKAVFCIRGGYGCTRLLDKIDYDLIKDNPKILLGYSDITAFHSAFNKFCNLITFHGPLTGSDFGKKELIDFTWQNTWNILEDNIKLPYKLQNHYTPVCINEGTAKGPLIGGNMAVLCALLGTKYAPDFEGKILFIEDIGEYLYRLDRYLIQLKLAGVFEKVSAVVFGDFTDIVHTNDDEVNRLTITDVIKDVLRDIKTPCFYGFSCGHAQFKTTIAVGADHEIDCSTGILKIVEPFTFSE